MSPADHNIAEEATLVRSGAMSTSRLYARHQPTMELTTRSDAKDGASASRSSRDGRRGCKLADFLGSNGFPRTSDRCRLQLSAPCIPGVHPADERLVPSAMGKKDGKRAPPVQSETLEPGDGTTFPSEGQSLTVHYTGTLAADGTEFDSSRAKGVPFTFVLGAGKVIRGWELGLASMSLGQRCRLAISAEAGYGKSGCEDRANASGTGVIPPHADLIFDVELLDIDDRRGVATEGRLLAYAKTLDAWVAGKMAKFDAEPEFAAAKAKKHAGTPAL